MGCEMVNWRKWHNSTHREIGEMGIHSILIAVAVETALAHQRAALQAHVEAARI